MATYSTAQFRAWSRLAKHPGHKITREQALQMLAARHDRGKDGRSKLKGKGIVLDVDANIRREIDKGFSEAVCEPETTQTL